MTESIVSFENVSKAFNIYGSPRDMFAELVTGRVRHDVFWALRNLSFDIKNGERLGVIGPNGAGKSTLLRLIVQNLQPSSGRITVRGEVSSMLSLTSYLSPNETGLENIRTNLLMKGFDERKIKPIIEEIIDFTELGAFIHAPVKTYSSGMNARLSFAISTTLAPDILVVDEVLGVGDGYFVGKAVKRMKDLCDRGRCLILVSHAMQSVQMLCNKVLWLENGEMRMVGDVTEVTTEYERDTWRSHNESMRGQQNSRLRTLAVLPEIGDLEHDTLRFRLMPSSGDAFRDNHFVQSIMIAVAGQEYVVPVAALAADGEAAAPQLDLVKSEWGRVYEHLGVESRSLARVTGRQRGGHMLVPRPANAQGDVTCTAKINYLASAELETLRLDYLDSSQGAWAPVPLVSDERRSKRGKNGWRDAAFEGTIRLATPEQTQTAAQDLEEERRADVEILDAEFFADGSVGNVVREGHPFAIRVTAEVRRPVPALDVGLRITRADGVYVFWQSSGQAAGNLDADIGTAVFTFTFDPNFLSSGEYQVTVAASNGWEPIINYPYTEVFDRKTGVLSFAVKRAFENVDFGALNVVVPTKIDFRPKIRAKIPQAS